MPDEATPHPPPPRGGRLSAAARALRARRDLALARRQQAGAFLELGAALAGAGTALGGEAERVRAEVARDDAAVEALGCALAASVDEDRRDYAEVSSWLRWLVVLRGLATRCLLRDRLRRRRRLRARACRRLGEAVVEGGHAVPPSAETVACAAREARSRVAASASRLELHLRRAGGAALPVVARHVGREAVALGRPLALEVRARVWPRLPALAGLAVGWWVASTFTDSRLGAALHSLGLGSGPRRAVSSRTLHAMEFWLPLLAAALCSYLSGRVGALVRARYAPGADGSATRQQGDPGEQG